MTTYCEIDNDFLVRRLSSISSLISETSRLKENIKTDPETRSFYTNNSVCERYIEINGEDSPPLLLRQHNNSYDNDKREYLEAQSNINMDYSKKLFELCTFSLDELRYIVSNKSNLLRLEGSLNNVPLLYQKEDKLYRLKYCQDELHKDQFDRNGFFLTRFIIEDDTIPLFDTLNYDGEKYLIYLQN